jgi:hypothetical protein
LGASAAALAIAAAAVFYLRRGHRQAIESVPQPSLALESSAAEITFAAGAVEAGPAPAAILAGTALAEGAVVRTTAGTACLRIEPGVRVCLDRDTEVVMRDKSLAHRRLNLAHGHLVASLDPQPAGAQFTVTSTNDAAVTAHGTVFSVETHGDGVVVRVHEGAVDAGAANRTRKVVAHESFTIGEPDSRPASQDEEALDRAIARPGDLWIGGPWSALDIKSDVPGAVVSVDGLSVGVAPIAMLVSPGTHSVRAGEPETMGELVRVSEGEHWSRTFTAPRAPTTPAVSTSGTRPPRGVPNRSGTGRATPADLLSKARDLRADGKAAEAAAAYRELEAQYPKSPEAHASFVLLGDIELANLNDASGALRSFNAYLVGGGELAQEAKYGRIRALRALGRSAEERKAIEDFVATYPKSVQTRTLQSRLEELRKP